MAEDAAVTPAYDDAEAAAAAAASAAAATAALAAAASDSSDPGAFAAASAKAADAAVGRRGPIDAVVLAVFDGHGEDGHLVSGYFREHIAAAVLGSRRMQEWVPVADNIPPPPPPPPPPVPTAAAPGGAAAATTALVDPASEPGYRPKTGVKPPVGPPRLRRNVLGALREGLAACERAVLADPLVDCSLSGCTGCVAVICGADVFVANVGDSRAVLLRHAPVPASIAGAAASIAGASPSGASAGAAQRAGAGGGFIPHTVTVDHKPTMASETRRILLKGGRVHAIKYDDGGEGPMRVWLRNDDVPGLAMSRSLCDSVGKKAGVSSEPDLYVYTLTPADAYLLLASDGLWEFTSSGDAAAVVARAGAEAAAAAAEAAAASEGLGAAPAGLHLELALEGLVQLAAARWHEREGVVDDTSIVLAEVGSAATATAVL